MEYVLDASKRTLLAQRMHNPKIR